MARSRVRPDSRSFFRDWLVFGGLLAVLGVAWSLATPLPSGPDEPTQFIKAASVAAGTVIGEGSPDLPSAQLIVTVPTQISHAGVGTGCFYGRPAVSAACESPPPPGQPPSLGTGRVVTYIGRYPPLYYALVGVPSRVSTSPAGLRAMRGTSAVLCALLLGLAFATARRWSTSRMVLIGLSLAITPATLYLASVINPNGLEIAAATLLWTAAAILVVERHPDPPGGLVAVTVVAAIVFAATRPLSPGYVLVVLASLTLLRPRGVLRLLRAPVVWAGVAVATVGVGLSAAFVLVERSYVVNAIPLRPGTTWHQILSRTLALIPEYAKDLFGAYGSPEMNATPFVVLLFGSSLLVLIGAAMARVRLHEAAVLLACGLGFVLALPLAADLLSARTQGIIWQGRYQMPLAVGVPILAAVLLGARGVQPGRVVRVLAPAIAAVGLGYSYYYVHRRYAVGIHGPLNPFVSGPGVWQPPVSATVLFAVMLVATLGYVLAVTRGTRPPTRQSHRSPERLVALPWEEVVLRTPVRPPGPR